jgi:hypothetical protein
LSFTTLAKPEGKHNKNRSFPFKRFLLNFKIKGGAMKDDHPTACIIHVTATLKADYVKRVLNDLGVDAESYFTDRYDGDHDVDAYGGIRAWVLSFSHIMDFSSGLDFFGDEEGNIKLPYSFYTGFRGERNFLHLNRGEAENVLRKAKEMKGADSYLCKELSSDQGVFLYGIAYDGEAICFSSHYHNLYSPELAEPWNKKLGTIEFPYNVFAKNVFAIMKDKADNDEYFGSDLLYDAFYGYTDFTKGYGWSEPHVSIEELTKATANFSRELNISEKSDSHIQRLNKLIRAKGLRNQVPPYWNTTSQELQDLEDAIYVSPESDSFYQMYALRRFNRLLIEETFPDCFQKKTSWASGIKKYYPVWDICREMKYNKSKSDEEEFVEEEFFNSELQMNYDLYSHSEVVFESIFGQIRVEVVTVGSDRYSVRNFFFN